MKNSLVLAAGLLLLMIVWMALGQPDKKGGDHSISEEVAEVSVEVRSSKAQTVSSYIKAHGDLLPFRETWVLAETYGEVEKRYYSKGEKVEQGDLLIQLSIEDREVKLKRAQALKLEMKNKYQANKNLKSKGFTAQSKLDELWAAYEAAQAEEKIIQQEIDQLQIRAPFSGVISDKKVEAGDYIFKGDPVMELIDTSAMLASVYVAQTDYPFLQLGAKAMVNLATGERLPGRLHYISPKADSNTKTFKVEVLLEKTSGIPSGISVTAEIPKGSTSAHLISSALLTLNDEGIMGVKTVNSQNRVEFYPVKLLQAHEQGIYVTGLTEEVQLIITGQGFVREGQKVQVSQMRNHKVSESSIGSREK